MATEQMKLVSIEGKKQNINEFIAKYILDSGIQVENVLRVLDQDWKLTYLESKIENENNLKKCTTLLEELGVSYEKEKPVDTIYNPNQKEVENQLKEIDQEYEKIEKRIEVLRKEREEAKKIAQPVQYLKDIPVDLKRLYELRYLRFRFGKIPKSGLEKIEKQMETMEAIFFVVGEEEDKNWILYFTTQEASEKIDGYFNIMKFERVSLPKEIEARPKEYLLQMTSYLENSGKQLKIYEGQKEIIGAKYKYKLLEICEQMKLQEQIDNIRSYIAQNEKGSFYLIGWLPSKEAEKLKQELENELSIECEIKDGEETGFTPPIQKKPRKEFHPFQTLAKKYTTLKENKQKNSISFLSMIAFILFGYIFGDIGQGTILLIVGFIIGKKSKVSASFRMAGISSILFGTFYGSVFERKDLLPSFIISPMENKIVMLGSAIAVGIIYLFSILLITTKKVPKTKELGKKITQNGLGSCLFYTVMVGLGAYFIVTGKNMLFSEIWITMFIATIGVIGFRNPIENAIQKKKIQTKSSFLIRGLETLERMAFPTKEMVSFSRFALFSIHYVGLCMAVYLVVDKIKEFENLSIMILVNVVIIGIEGLILAIQALQLQECEESSRFDLEHEEEYSSIQKDIEEQKVGE